MRHILTTHPHRSMNLPDDELTSYTSPLHPKLSIKGVPIHSDAPKLRPIHKGTVGSYPYLFQVQINNLEQPPSSSQQSRSSRAFRIPTKSALRKISKQSNDDLDGSSAQTPILGRNTCLITNETEERSPRSKASPATQRVTPGMDDRIAGDFANSSMLVLSQEKTSLPLGQGDSFIMREASGLEKIFQDRGRVRSAHFEDTSDSCIQTVIIPHSKLKVSERSKIASRQSKSSHREKAGRYSKGSKGSMPTLQEADSVDRGKQIKLAKKYFVGQWEKLEKKQRVKDIIKKFEKQTGEKISYNGAFSAISKNLPKKCHSIDITHLFRESSRESQGPDSINTTLAVPSSRPQQEVSVKQMQLSFKESSDKVVDVKNLILKKKPMASRNSTVGIATGERTTSSNPNESYLYLKPKLQSLKIKRTLLGQSTGSNHQRSRIGSAVTKEVVITASDVLHEESSVLSGQTLHRQDVDHRQSSRESTAPQERASADAIEVVEKFRQPKVLGGGQQLQKVYVMPQYIIRKDSHTVKHPLKTVRILQQRQQLGEEVNRSSSLPKINKSYIGHQLQRELVASASTQTIEDASKEKLILKYRHDQPLRTLVHQSSPPQSKDEAGKVIAERLNRHRILSKVASQQVLPPPKEPKAEQYWHDPRQDINTSEHKMTLAKAQKQASAGLFRFNPNREDRHRVGLRRVSTKKILALKESEKIQEEKEETPRSERDRQRQGPLWQPTLASGRESIRSRVEVRQNIGEILRQVTDDRLKVKLRLDSDRLRVNKLNILRHYSKKVKQIPVKPVLLPSKSEKQLLPLESVRGSKKLDRAELAALTERNMEPLPLDLALKKLNEERRQKIEKTIQHFSQI